MRRKINNSIPKKIDTKKNGGVAVVQLSTYTSPKVVEVRNQEWVSYGEDNDYFGYLQDRINGSPTNNAIVNGISQMIFGRGLDATDSTQKPLDYAKAKQLFDDDTVERLCNDLKAMGQCAVQVIYSIDKSTILECNHFPVETLRSGKCNEDGEVETYYYSDNWKEVNRNKKPTPIPAFGFGSTPEDMSNLEEILYIKPYKTGFYYYSPVDYQGGLQYAELEEEISNYHLNNIMNGLAPSMLINFNNGTPTEDEQRDIERNIQNKFSGSSNAGRFILSFNDSTEYNATITPVQLSDAHNQYQFLSDESMRKIMLAHRVISPMLLGIKDNTGLGNNADELKTASTLMDNTVIRPFQNLLIKNFNRVLSYNKIALDLYFKTLQPLEFTDLTNATDIKTIEEETGQKQAVLSTQNDCYDINSFDGEKMSEEWVLADKREFSDDNSSIEQWASEHIKKKDKVSLADYIKSNANSESYLDKDIYKVRYEYSEKYSSSTTREFCVNMMNRTASGVVYRKEDIDQASFMGVNNSFGHKGENYSLFRFKGGVNCGHYWTENLYRLKQYTDGSYYEDKALSSSEQVNNIDGYNPTPAGLDDAKTAPFDMPNRGHHPNYKG